MRRFFSVFLILIFSVLNATLCFSQNSSDEVQERLYGIWEGKDRFVFFERTENEDERQIVILLKEYYGWYYDRAVEPKEYNEKSERTRNSATTKNAVQIYYDIEKTDVTSDDFCAFELELDYSRRQKSLVPLLIYDGKMYLDFYLQSQENPKIYTGHSVSGGITMFEQEPSENIGVLYLNDDAVYDVRYWKSDMEFSSENVLFKRSEIEFYVPKHVMSQNQNYSCVSGRSKKIRNPQKSFTLEERRLTFMGQKAEESPFLIADSEPYLVQVAGKDDFEALMQIVKEANSRRKPDPPALFPPHDPPLDWHWDLIDALEKYNPYIQAVRQRQKEFGTRAKDLNK